MHWGWAWDLLSKSAVPQVRWKLNIGTSWHIWVLKASFHFIPWAQRESQSDLQEILFEEKESTGPGKSKMLSLEQHDFKSTVWGGFRALRSIQTETWRSTLFYSDINQTRLRCRQRPMRLLLARAMHKLSFTFWRDDTKRIFKPSWRGNLVILLLWRPLA